MTSSEEAASARNKSRPPAGRHRPARAAARLTEAPAPSEPEDPTTAVAADAIAGTDPVGMPVLGEAVGDLGQALRPDGDRGRERPQANRPTCAHSGRIVGRRARSEGLAVQGPSLVGTPDLPSAWSELSGRLRIRRRGARRSGPQRSSDDGSPVSSCGMLESAAAPTNALLGNPAAVKRAFETGGVSLLRGTRNWLGDVVHNGGMPSTVDREAYQVGRDLAVTPGAVVDRDEYAEIIQYQPTTETVQARPVLVVPPPIGRYYFLDLRPGRSFVEYAVSRGLPTFMLSWRNPTKHEGDWNLDNYAARVLCGHRHRPGDHRLGGRGPHRLLRRRHSADLGAQPPGCPGGRARAHGELRRHPAGLRSGGTDPARSPSPRLLALARWNSQRAGVISARNMGNVFTWMRPNELVWNYWVNNYLMGNKPPAFDILAWNADGTNLPARLHGQFLDIFERNVLCRPGEMTVLGTPVDLATHHDSDLRHRRNDRPPDAVDRLLSDDAAVQRSEHVRPQQCGAHPEPGQPARQPEGDLLRRRRAGRRSADLAERR